MIPSLYVLIEWPDSQNLMEKYWFEKEAILAANENVGSSTYFIPLKRYNELTAEFKMKLGDITPSVKSEHS